MSRLPAVRATQAGYAATEHRCRNLADGWPGEGAAVMPAATAWSSKYEGTGMGAVSARQGPAATRRVAVRPSTIRGHIGSGVPATG